MMNLNQCIKNLLFLFHSCLCINVFHHWIWIWIMLLSFTILNLLQFYCLSFSIDIAQWWICLRWIDIVGILSLYYYFYNFRDRDPDIPCPPSISSKFWGASTHSPCASHCSCAPPSQKLGGTLVHIDPCPKGMFKMDTIGRQPCKREATKVQQGAMSCLLKKRTRTILFYIVR